LSYSTSGKTGTNVYFSFMPNKKTSSPKITQEMADKAFGFICIHKSMNDGNSPSADDIADYLEVNKRVVPDVLEYLHAEGRIQKDRRGKARMIIVVGGRWIPPHLAAQYQQTTNVPSEGTGQTLPHKQLSLIEPLHDIGGAYNG